MNEDWGDIKLASKRYAFFSVSQTSSTWVDFSFFFFCLSWPTTNRYAPPEDEKKNNPTEREYKRIREKKKKKKNRGYPCIRVGSALRCKSLFCPRCQDISSAIHRYRDEKTLQFVYYKVWPVAKLILYQDTQLSDKRVGFPTGASYNATPIGRLRDTYTVAHDGSYANHVLKKKKWLK